MPFCASAVPQQTTITRPSEIILPKKSEKDATRFKLRIGLSFSMLFDP
jgi:hypothetical protein